MLVVYNKMADAFADTSGKNSIPFNKSLSSPGRNSFVASENSRVPDQNGVSKA